MKYGAIFILILSSCLIFGILMYIIGCDKIQRNTYQYDLIQVSNTKDLNGHMSFLGSGHVNEKPYYYMYVKKNNGIELLKLEAENYHGYTITIFQDNNEPYIKSIGQGIYAFKRNIEIHIPPGSIVQNIDINSGNFK